MIVQDYIEEAHKVPLIVIIPKRLHNFKNFILIIENNPIQQAMSIKPYRSIEALGMNIRLEDDSPVRAAVLEIKNGIMAMLVQKWPICNLSAGGCKSPACDPSVEVCETNIR